MRYRPPLIFAHCVLYERSEKEIGREKIEQMFGPGGRLPGPDDRWLTGRVQVTELAKWDLDKSCTGQYVGFRNRDDQFLFYMTFTGVPNVA